MRSQLTRPPRVASIEMTTRVSCCLDDTTSGALRIKQLTQPFTLTAMRSTTWRELAACGHVAIIVAARSREEVSHCCARAKK